MLSTEQKLKAQDLTNTVIAQAAVTSELWKAEGQDAWSALKRIGGGKLPEGDEIILARNLYQEFQKIKPRLKQRGKSVGDFCEEADLSAPGASSKELYRLMVPPGETPQSGRLRRDASKYRSLISAMAKELGEDRARLTNRVTRGSSLHPRNTAFRERLESIQAVLDAHVWKVDQEFGLFETFRKTAEIKAQHVKDGGTCRWPQGDADWLDVSGDADLPKDPKYAYWITRPIHRDVEISYMGNGTYCVIDDEFFHVPHAYLGYGQGLFFQMNFSSYLRQARENTEKNSAIVEPTSRYADHAEAVEALKKECVEQYKPTMDEWDAALEQPRGQDSSSLDARYHAWLIIYPSPEGDRLIPMLLVPVEEGGPFMVPLDSPTLSVMKGDYWVDPDGTVEPFLDRLERMMGYRDGSEDLILKGLRRTAPWLAKNPFMKMQAQKKRELVLMNAYYQKLMSE